MSKRALYVILVILIIGGIVWFSQNKKPKTIGEITKDTTIEGDYAIEKGQRVVVKNNAVLTINGNLNLAGEFAGEDGSNLAVVVKGSVNIGPDAEIKTGGSVQLVERENLLAKTPEQIDKLYDDAGSDSGEGQRIGPFTEEGGPIAQNLVPEQGRRADEQPARKINFVNHAQAASHTVVVGGKITVPTPPAGVRQVVVFNFPTAVGMEIDDLDLTGPNGRDGADDKGASCNAKGKDGEDAFRFLAYAGNLTVKKFTLALGSGGNGGDAETTKDCDSGIATGGKGGKSGNVKMVAGNEFKITGAFVINPGKGGAGGAATAQGKDGGPSEKGGDATATGGNGADNQKKLSIAGNVAGTDNVQIGSVYGGDGGKATARPGRGGDGIGCAKPGGPGGKATSTGGDGGKASLSLAGGATRTPGAQDVGGNGGDADSIAGRGGDGGDCGPEGPGGPGGNGGDAKSTKGNGGTGTSAAGQDGAVIAETGGDGGTGGDGCPEGAGGKGGAGNPPGKDGGPGKNLCEKPGTSQTSPPPTDGQVTSPTPTPPTSTTQPKEKMQVIRYQGKYLPVSQLIIENEAGCGAEHYHAAEGVVTATDGSKVPDPGPQCGYGKVSELPTMEVEIGQ